jgi:hypothetical protein
MPTSSVPSLADYPMIRTVWKRALFEKFWDEPFRNPAD